MSKVMGVAIPRVKRSPSTGGARASNGSEGGGNHDGEGTLQKKNYNRSNQFRKTKQINSLRTFVAGLSRDFA
jgi:hypothetical protein